MRISLLILAVFAVLGSPAAEAQRRRKPVKPAPKARPEPPKPGTCETVPGAVRIRRCYPVGAVGQFTAKVAGGSTLLLEFDEPVLDFLRPSKRYFSTKNLTARSYMIRPVQHTWPDYVVATIKTRTMSVTISFKSVPAGQADLQMHVMRLDRRNKDAEVERRVKSARALLAAKYTARLRKLDKRAAQLSRDNIVNWLLADGAQIRAARGKRRVYKRHLIVKTHARIKIGSERFVQFTVRNQHEDIFTFSRPAVMASRNGATARLLPGARVRCSKRRLLAGRTAACVVGLALGREPHADERITIVVREARGDRRATLRGIDVR